MATFKVFIDGALRTFTAAEYVAEFGYVPTSPRDGERLWGGRYEHRTFASASTSDGDNGELGVVKNTGNSLTASIAGHEH